MPPDLVESPNILDFKSHIAQTKERIDTELVHCLSHYSNLALFEQIRYAALSPGKRLRPILVLLSSEVVRGTQGEEEMSLAVAFELIHAATLVHDDVMDEGKTRRGLTSVYGKWGRNVAVLTGDALIALAIKLSSEYGNRILKIASESALELCDGQFMDVSRTLNSEEPEDYFVRIRKKSAALFRAAAECGALSVGGTTEEVARLSSFGENLGMAYQLMDDYVDSLIDRYGANHGSLISIPFRMRINGKKRLDMSKSLDSIARAFSLDKDSEVLQQYRELIGCHIDKACSDIQSLRVNRYRSYLEEFARSLPILISEKPESELP